MQLAVEQRDVNGSTSIIALRGKLMLGPAAAQLEKLIPELVQKGRRNLVFDLSGVTHIDSTGIGRFIDAYGRLMQSGGQMRLAGATGAVRDSFRVTRLDTVFKFYPTVEAACEGLD
jgi:anti-sigma B factor antagonist